MFYPSVIEVSREALKNNLDFIRSQLRENTRLCSVVKGNAYGHSLLSFVGMAMEYGVDYFAVYSVDEAYTLRSRLEAKPDIYIMGMADDEELEWAILNDVEVCIFDFDRLADAAKFATKLHKKALIHLELETGMNRTGFSLEELPAVSMKLKAHPDCFDLVGISTHFAGSESLANDFRVRKQIEAFNHGVELLQQDGITARYNHVACSAALMNYPDTAYNMVRVGIMQYGFWPNKETYIRYVYINSHMPNPLRRLITWKSRVMATKEVEQGQFIGYGTAFLAAENMRIAVIPIGYAHGYSRALSNTGQVLIRGQKAKVTGIVNMNAITVDITHIPEVRKGDEVVLIGNQGDESISVSSFGEQSDQLNYELLIRLPKDIPRVIVE